MVVIRDHGLPDVPVRNSVDNNESFLPADVLQTPFRGLAYLSERLVTHIFKPKLLAELEKDFVQLYVSSHDCL